MNVFKFKAKVMRFPGYAAWHYTHLPKKDYLVIKNRFSDLKRGWGSLPVNATIGKTTWKTSIFPDTKTSSYILPLKKEVLNKEKLVEDKITSINIRIIL